MKMAKVSTSFCLTNGIYLTWLMPQSSACMGDFRKCPEILCQDKGETWGNPADLARQICGANSYGVDFPPGAWEAEFDHVAPGFIVAPKARRQHWEELELRISLSGSGDSTTACPPCNSFHLDSDRFPFSWQ
jgi:hypothetical protein